jgi:hypothetical protein
MRHKLANGDSHGTRRTSSEYGVFDETTGKCVGAVSFDKVPRAGHKSCPTGPFDCSTPSTSASTPTWNALPTRSRPGQRR